MGDDMFEDVTFGHWTLRFAKGERAAHRASGAWSGRTVADYARDRAAAMPDRVAVSDEVSVLTYAGALARGTALARALLDRGLAPGDTIAFQLPNWTEGVVINLAAALAGLVVTPIVPIYRQAELRFILRDCRARAIFVPESFRGVDYPALIAEVRGEAPELDHVFALRGASDDLAALIAEGERSTTPLAGADPDSAKVIIYTSGTTGEPKGVIWSHNQSRVSSHWSLHVWRLGEESRLFMPSPITHVTGYFNGLETPFTFGTRAFLAERWDVRAALSVIDGEGIEYMIGATPFLSELVEAAEASGTRLPSLRIFACGGAAVPPDLIRKADAAFANCRSFRVYGSSETPMITHGDLESRERAATMDGRIVDWEVKVVDERGATVPNGTEGEILARGPAMFRGYTRAGATDAAFDAEGYFRTGDLGIVDAEGSIVITGRKKDLIIRGGENLSAKEIEDALHAHPDIREAAVVAFPHLRMGEGVAACLVAKGAARPDQAALADYLKARGLARQKWPERVRYYDDLPKTASGKVKKHELRAELRGDEATA